MKETILVTGSSGYVGSHTVKYLSQTGCNVVGLDIEKPNSTLQKYLSAHLIADISDQNVLPFLKKSKVSGVIHCAAKCLVAESVEKPDYYHDHNVIRSTQFIHQVLAAGIQRLVFSSTAATYGEPTQVPIPESHVQKPINPYGKSKLLFEAELLKLNSAGKLNVGIVRYFNAAGADPEHEMGEVHDPETHLIPNAVMAALGKKKEFLLFGTDYPTRDGTCERDFVHVWDLAQAHLKQIQKLTSAKDAVIYNLGSAQGYTVKEVCDEIDLQTNSKLPRKLMPRRPGDPAVLVADSTKARTEIDSEAYVVHSIKSGFHGTGLAQVANIGYIPTLR